MTLNSSMAEALRLTRAGDLAGATALLQTALSGGSVPAAELPAADVIDLIPERVTLGAKGEHRAPRPTAPAERFEARRHTGPAGAIDYMLYRPASAAPGMPLVIMLHGCTQSPEDFARGTAMNRLAEEFGFLVAYPRQTQAANVQKCWNWFEPGNQVRGRGEPALIAGLTRDILAAEEADHTRVYVAGLSAGGAAAAIMADSYPDLFAAVGIHSGLACGAARDLPSALAAMKRGAARRVGPRAADARFVPVITIPGDRDGTVHEVNAREIVGAATAATGTRITVEMERGEAGGRHYTRALSRDDGGQVLIEQWTIAGAGHAWSGGDPAGSYADAAGPDASRAMLRFFLDHSRAET
jgi:poly(hydroxyalkanoate) depolymerase family esterase